MQLYNPQKNQIDAFWDYAYKKIKGYSVIELYVFAQAILRGLKIVWIPLDEKKDNPQAIFEGLNDKGKPLSSIELLCSYLFKPLIDEVTKHHETIHNEKWLKVIKKVDGEQRFEEYLRNLFSIDKPKMIGKGRRLYASFKNANKKLDKQTAFVTIEDIAKNVDVYNQIKHPTKSEHKHPVKEINLLLIKINQTGMESCTPFILALLIALRDGKVNEANTIIMLNVLLVLLVRRKITELRVTKYDAFFPSLLSKVIGEPDKHKAMIELLRKEDLWVSNQEFEEAFISKALYKQTELEFARLILQEIDRKFHSHGQFPDYSTINTIEHVLPQTLNEEWTTYLGKEIVTDINLDRFKNSIGNLCLISRPANSAAGRNPFEKKVNSYTDITGLTKDLKERITETWNIESIKKRSKDLADKALAVWAWN